MESLKFYCHTSCMALETICVLTSYIYSNSFINLNITPFRVVSFSGGGSYSEQEDIQIIRTHFYGENLYFYVSVVHLPYTVTFHYGAHYTLLQ